MLEVTARSGPARNSRWKVGDAKCVLPNIIYSGPAEALPSGAELAAVREDGRTDVLCQGAPLFSLPDAFYPPLSTLRHTDGFELVEGDNAIILRGDMKVTADVREKKFDVAVLGNAFELRRDARMFVRSLVSLRRKVGNRRPIYVPGMMDPSNLALLSYLGVELFDDTLISLFVSKGKVCTTEGPLPAKDATWLLANNASALKVSLTNAYNELQLVRHMTKQERLRELVEDRVHSSPWMVAALRIFDEEFYDFQEERWPVIGPRFYANAKQSLFRPDVWRYRKQILERYRRPEHKKILLLLPCSAKKPYYTSKSHHAFRQVIQSVTNYDVVHEVIVTSPISVVPRELELFYPAAQYDIPVTGHWDREEVAMVQELVRHIISQGYDMVISHLGDEAEFVQQVTDCIDTSHGNPTSRDSLNHLYEVLAENCAKYERVPMGLDRQRTMAAVARFQFGPGAEVLLDDCKVSGTYPYSRMIVPLGNRQMGMLTPERGMISLTVEGAERLVGKGLGFVRIKDFEVEGNLFAVGVDDADDNIRVGDEVGVMRGGKVVGVGVAMMFGSEMRDSDRGEAVRMRHYVKKA